MFRSQAHQQRFEQTMTRIGKVYDGTFDPEYGAAIYCLSASLSTWDKVKGYVTSSGIRIEAMLEDVDFSGGESVLVKWAGNLFNGRVHVDPLDVLRLSENNFETALRSLLLRRNGMSAEHLKQGENHEPVHGER
jgi:hypothetical protein